MCLKAGDIRKGVIFVTAAERLLNHLHAGRKSAVVLHDPSNMFYLTEGYTGEGLVYLSEAQKVIVTDFRYTACATNAISPDCIMNTIYGKTTSTGTGNTRILSYTTSRRPFINSICVADTATAIAMTIRMR